MLRLAGLTVAIAALVTFATVIAIVIGAAAGLWGAIMLRTLAVLTVLAVLLAWAVSQWRTISARGFLVAAIAAYLLMPLGLGGRTLLTQLLTDRWWVGMIGDGVLWIGFAAGVVRVQTARHPRVEVEDELGVLR